MLSALLGAGYDRYHRRCSDAHTCPRISSHRVAGSGCSAPLASPSMVMAGPRSTARSPDAFPDRRIAARPWLAPDASGSCGSEIINSFACNGLQKLRRQQRQRFTTRAGMKAQTRKADRVSEPATRYRPDDKVPVWPFSQPITVGLTNPARFAVELISPIPAAAPTPPRNDVGKAQNICKALIMPTAAMVSPSIDSTELPAVLAHNTKPQAANRAGTITCQRRSRRLSAL